MRRDAREDWQGVDVVPLPPQYSPRRVWLPAAALWMSLVGLLVWPLAPVALLAGVVGWFRHGNDAAAAAKCAFAVAASTLTLAVAALLVTTSVLWT